MEVKTFTCIFLDYLITCYFFVSFYTPISNFKKNLKVCYVFLEILEDIFCDVLFPDMQLWNSVNMWDFDENVCTYNLFEGF